MRVKYTSIVRQETRIGSREKIGDEASETKSDNPRALGPWERGQFGVR